MAIEPDRYPGNPVQSGGQYRATPVSLEDKEFETFLVDEQGRLVTVTTAALEVSDLEIGAVEIKDGDSDERLDVGAVSGLTSADNGIPTAAFSQGMAASDAAAVGNPVQIGGVYLAAGGSPDEGDVNALLLDAIARLVVTQGTLQAGEDLAANVLGILQKPVASSLYAPTPGFNAGAATAISVKATPGNLYWVSCSNANAAVRYLQIHDKASAPTAGNTPILSFVIPAGTAAAPSIAEITSAMLGPSIYCATGIALGISTTAGTYTAATANEHQTNWGYV